ncbi:hypothetical protein ACOMHN_041623 [Nucella lapillus]
MQNKQFPGKSFIIEDEDILSVPTDVGKKKRKEIKAKRANRFLKRINAFMNEGCGMICLHLKDPHMLGHFEQTVNPRMADLIPDDTPFHDNFERHILGKNHVIFRVKPTSGMLSTFCFNSKISLDCGVEDPTQGQMRYLMKHKRDPATDDKHKFSFNFTRGQNVKVEIEKVGENGTKEESVFQECKSIQAKSVPKIQGSFCDILKSVFFEKDKMGTFLPKYISAFSKLPRGGSIFLGIKEAKIETPKWTRVEKTEKNQLLTLHNPNFDLWKDKDGQYLIAENSPVGKALEPGEFKCEGIKLTQEERETLPERVKQLIKKNMLWCAGGPQPHVGVEYHRVEGTDGSEALFVVEFQVHRYQGMGFFEPGPIAYRISKGAEGEHTEKMSVEDWCEIIEK